MMLRAFNTFLILVSLLVFFTSNCDAVIFPFEIFDAEGQLVDTPGLDLYVEVTNGEGKANFIFYNDSIFDCSVAQIYFDDGSLLGIDYIINGPGTEFDRAFPGPGNLPGGENLIPPFVADREFNIGAVSPPPENGVNSIPAGEWVEIDFDLINGGDLEDVIDELNIRLLRVGLHVISFPDGSSKSAILVPEPATIFLFGIGAGLLLKLRKKR